MNTSAALTLFCAALGAGASGFLWRISRARAWRELRWFSLVALTAAIYAACNLLSSLSLSSGVLLAAARLQLCAGIVECWAWTRYSEAYTASSRPVRRAIDAVLLGAACAALVPRLAYRGAVVPGAYTRMGVAYTGAVPSLVGHLLMALALVAMGVSIWRFASAHRRRVPYALLHAGSALSVTVLAANDALVTTGVLKHAFLLDIGFTIPVALVTWSIIARFTDAARDLDALRARLEVTVAERTAALYATQESLFRAERLASLGGLANGIVHQLSNPASVVTANLRLFVEGRAAEEERQEVASEALAAMNRINTLTRQLADAGRIAFASRPDRPTDVAETIDRVVRVLADRRPARIAVSVEAAPGLFVRMRAEVLEQVINGLAQNAVEAIPEGKNGRVEIRAQHRSNNVRITVSDDGVGLSSAVALRAFEPFFSTKPPGKSSGLGLSVVRGVVEAHGGSLTLEGQTSPSRGACLALELPAAEPPAASRGRETVDPEALDDEGRAAPEGARGLSPTL